MNRIVISALLLVVIYAMNGCVGTQPDAAPPTAGPTVGLPTQPVEPTAALATPTHQVSVPTPVLAQPTPTTPVKPPPGVIGTPQIPPPIDSNPTRPVETVIADPTLLKLVNEAKADLMDRMSVLSDEIQVVSAEPVEWRDSSLGCPMPGEMYAQVITPGYLIVLETGGTEYNYHASTTRIMLCEK